MRIEKSDLLDVFVEESFKEWDADFLCRDLLKALLTKAECTAEEIERMDRLFTDRLRARRDLHLEEMVAKDKNSASEIIRQIYAPLTREQLASDLAHLIDRQIIRTYPIHTTSKEKNDDRI